MPDMTMCANADCPHREACYRAQAKPSPLWQSHAAYEPRSEAPEDCDGFLPLRGEDPPF